MHLEAGADPATAGALVPEVAVKPYFMPTSPVRARQFTLLGLSHGHPILEIKEVTGALLILLLFASRYIIELL